MNSYVICRTQYENLGDLIINKMLIDELSQYGTVFTDVFSVPEKFSKPLLENENVKDTKDFGFINRGGRLAGIKQLLFFFKHRIRLYSSSPGPMYSENPQARNRNYYQFLRKISQIFGTHYYRIGNCCSHLIIEKHDYNEGIVDAYYLRSSESVSYLKSQTKRDNVHYIPDLCFLLKFYAKSIPKKKIAIIDIRIVNQQKSRTFNWCKLIVDNLLSQGFKVELYYQVERDKEEMYNLYRFLDNPEITCREDIVWYNDLHYFDDKMVVISNRLHSLLVAAAYGVFPICLYDESPLTAKLIHVFNSSFDSSLPILLKYGELPAEQYVDLYDNYNDKVQAEYLKNACICREIIKRIADMNV